jgi:hypothetical protein
MSRNRGNCASVHSIPLLNHPSTYRYRVQKRSRLRPSASGGLTALEVVTGRCPVDAEARQRCETLAAATFLAVVTGGGKAAGCVAPVDQQRAVSRGAFDRNRCICHEATIVAIATGVSGDASDGAARTKKDNGDYSCRSDHAPPNAGHQSLQEWSSRQEARCAINAQVPSQNATKSIAQL